MAKAEFLDNFRVARNLFAHHQVQAYDPTNRAAIWLTPKSVKGFRPDDFPELGASRQQELAAAIQDFLQVAQHVPATSPATTEQLNAAKAAFAKAVNIFEPYLPSHEEWRKTEDALGTVVFPPWVANWSYEFGSDEEGLPIILVTVYVDEQGAWRQPFSQNWPHLDRAIGQAISAAGIKRWHYVRVRTALDYKTA